MSPLHPLHVSLLALAAFVAPLHATDLGSGFVDETLLTVGASPATLKFSPSGDLYYGLRIEGELYRVPFGDWNNPQLLYTFDIPKDAGGLPDEHRSSGLRDITFSDDGQYLYAFFMRDSPRHNRVVRLEIDAENPSAIVPGSETPLLDIPFNGSASSGSHNGGAIEFGGDGYLYITTGDGWNGGDPVQSIGTYTGKVFRIASDGTIPSQNPFYGQASGPLRAIYSLGCRNPFSMSYRAADGALFINETTGANKSDVFVVADAANYKHQGFGGIGVATSKWLNASTGGHLNTGSAWYDDWRFTTPPPKPWPPTYHGGLFLCQWGTNSGGSGRIVFVPSGSTTPQEFGSSVSVTGGDGQTLKPACLRMGPDGHLYYLLTTYQTTNGQVRRIRYTGQATAITPSVSPAGGAFPGPTAVTLSSPTPAANIHFTLDGSPPDPTDPLYVTPVTLSESATLKARAYATDFAASGVAEATFTIGAVQNAPPVAIGGPGDVLWPLGRLHTLNGSASFDPDGSNELLSDVWAQIGGPVIPNFDGNDFVSFFTPQLVGTYEFRLDVCDPTGGCDADEVRVTVVPCLNDVLDELTHRWLFEEISGPLAFDSSMSALHGALIGDPGWSSGTAYPQSSGAISFDGVDDAVAISSELDPSGAALTLTAWFRADDFDVPDARIISKATGATDAEHWFMLSTHLSGEAIRLRFRLKTEGVTSTLVAPTGDLVAGQWTHVAAVYDGDEMRLYKDGQLVGSQQKSGSINSAPSVATAIGNQPAAANGGGRPFDGLIDDVRVYARGLEPAEIELLANGPLLLTVPDECDPDPDSNESSFLPGDWIHGSISSTEDTDHAGFDGIKGLTLKLKTDHPSSAEPIRVTLLDELGTPLGSWIAKPGKQIKKKFTLDADGPFDLRVEGIDGSTGDFEIKTSRKLPEQANGAVHKKVKPKGENDFANVKLRALAGATLDVQIKPNQHVIGPLTLSLIDPDDQTVDLSDQLAPGGLAFTGAPLGKTGLYRVRVSGFQAPQAKVKVIVTPTQPEGDDTLEID